MGSRLSIVAGLLAGLLVAGALLVGFVFVGPDPVRPSPSAAPSEADPSPSPSASASPSTSPSASSFASPAGSASPTPPVSAPVGSPGASTVTENFHIGQPAPALAVPQVGGGTIDLASLKGKPVWINFMQTACPPCQDEFPLMNGYAARYAADGLVVVAVDIKEDEGDVASFATSLNATFPMGLDADGQAQQAWGAYGLPVHFWIDQAGIVRDGALGGIGADIMARGLQSILPGVTVTP
jgi:cytochrome c biogenesis protein CcmG, thiol:disulfide interchange protein DsbE